MAFSDAHHKDHCPVKQPYWAITVANLDKVQRIGVRGCSGSRFSIGGISNSEGQGPYVMLRSVWLSWVAAVSSGTLCGLTVDK